MTTQPLPSPRSDVAAPSSGEAGWIDYVHAPMFILDAAGRRASRCNAALCRLLALVPSETPLSLAAMLGAGAAEALLDFLDGARRDPARRSLTLLGETPAGSRRLIIHLAPLPEPDLWAVTVDERTPFFEDASNGAYSAETTFRSIIQALPIGIDLFDASWRAIFYNAYSDELYQYDPYYDIDHYEWFERAFPDPVERAEGLRKWQAAQAAIELNPAEPQHLEWRVLCRDGQYRTLHNMMSKIGTHYAFVYWDISEQRRLEDELRRLAETDMLTGLANRRRFFEVAEGLFAQPADAAPCALLLLDLDHFKVLNDTFGHHRGDEALVAVAKLATEALRPGELAARFGGEEFALLLSGPQPEVAERAEALRQRVAACRLPGPGGAIVLSTSIGLATRSADAPSLHQLIENADRALYAAKRSGRNRVVAHQPAAEPTP
ncbi:sensor domain-containing diguanylate cyclase [Acidisoma sp. 7E03]